VDRVSTGQQGILHRQLTSQHLGVLGLLGLLGLLGVLE
jgi:hypothetical protein